MKAAAQEFKTLFKSNNPKEEFCCSPGILVLPTGRIVATFDIYNSNGVSGDPLYFRPNVGKIYISDDGGETFTYKHSYPFIHARPFYSGGKFYVIGHMGDIMILSSNDNCETFSAVHKLTEGQSWHQAPCNVLKHNENIYLVMEQITDTDIKTWEVSVLAPTLMRAKENSNLLSKESWTFANAPAFKDIIIDSELDYFGVPFYPSTPGIAYFPAPKRGSAPIGWLETNVVKIYDEKHYWYDENAIHLIMRSHTGGTGFACIMKVLEKPDGTMTTDFQYVPSGKKQLYIPFPGGQMKFHILYDEKTKLYWLLSTQAKDSMTKAEFLPDDRYSIPNNERNRLQLHFSKNMVDWCFAALIATTDEDIASRHYASMDIYNDDLLILSRSGNSSANSAHNCNLITFHKLENFRQYVY